MAIDMFLKLDPVKGESLDDKHKDEIDVLSWSWGMNQTGTTHQGTRATQQGTGTTHQGTGTTNLGTSGGGGKASVQDLTFTHWVDKASADLIKACISGQHIARGTLIVRKAGGEALEYLKIDMYNLIITNVSTGGSHGDERLTENVTLNFQKFKYQYKQQTEKGAAGASPQFGWDISANKEA
jgi:type VI secretion system secreted protein Hcp